MVYYNQILVANNHLIGLLQPTHSELQRYNQKLNFIYPIIFSQLQHINYHKHNMEYFLHQLKH